MQEEYKIRYKILSKPSITVDGNVISIFPVNYLIIMKRIIVDRYKFTKKKIIVNDQKKEFCLK